MKKRNAHVKVDEAKQYAAFRKAARELRVDESKERFQDALRKIAKAIPAPAKARREK